MKKSLVLAMAMALGVTASAYAANPFSDVPAGHWAYDSISKLAAAGVIEGYGDATFGGDKLAAEFADELDNLGVRVANLEKKADNVKITGQIRAHYRDLDQGASVSKLRTRLFINGQINEDWSYTGRFQNEQVIAHSEAGEDDDTKLNWAFVTGKVGGAKVTAGRNDYKAHTGFVVDSTFDGVKVEYGKAVKLTGFAGKGAAEKRMTLADERFYTVDVATKLGVVDAYASYYKLDTAKENEIWNLGAALKVAKDLSLKADFMLGDADDNKDDKGYVVGLAYKGAKAATAGTWGLYANYFNQPEATFFAQTIDGYAVLPATYAADGDGFKGFEVGANYTIAKNIVAGVKYYDLEAREGEADNQTLWSEVVFTF